MLCLRRPRRWPRDRRSRHPFATSYASGGDVLPSRAPRAADASALAERARAVCDAGFAASLELALGGLEWLAGAEAAGLEHGQLEARVELDGREMCRQMVQDHLDRRAADEPRLEHVVGRDGARRGCVERGHERPLVTVFGLVRARRMAYRGRGRENLCPADAALSLPVEKHSHGLRRLTAIESARGSFDDAVAAIERATGVRVGKRQAEQLAGCAAVDFDGFYAQRRAAAVDAGDVLVLSCDGKGVVMRPGALREPTRRAAETSTTKLTARLSKGEKRNRKRMAEVGAVYDSAPARRSAADVLPANDSERAAAVAGPVARNKWLTASVCHDAATVVSDIFDEAERRDPEHARTWVALVDGNNHQIRRIQAEAKTRQVAVTIIVDFVHVIEYLWTAAWCFHKEGDPAAELWVRRHAKDILAGNATKVAGHIRRAATTRRLDPSQRKGADQAATYLTNKAAFLNYPSALAEGWPIATGVIEGACRHLVRDRIDITGARWGLPGAEAILKLRAIISNGDFDAYWRYHLQQEHQRVHQSRYANNPPGST